jgi:hypothetical protein
MGMFALQNGDIERYQIVREQLYARYHGARFERGSCRHYSRAQRNTNRWA